MRHRSANRRRVLLRLRRAASVRARGSRGDREQDARVRGSGSDLRAADVAARGGQAFLRQSRRDAQGPIDRGEDRGSERGLLLHDQGQGDVRRLLCWPARADHRKAEGVQVAHDVERVLERRRAQSANAARVRNRVPVGERPQGSPHAHRRSEEARPPEDRSRAEALHVPPVGAGCDVLAREGHAALQRARGLHARSAHPFGLHRGESADRLQQSAMGDLRALVALPAEHVPRRVRRRADGAEGDELPRAHAHLRQRDAELSRSPDPLSRADAAASQRGIRRAVRADARKAVQSRRWPLLRDGVADRRRSRAGAAPGEAGLRRLRDEARDEALDAAAGVPLARSSSGTTRRSS